MSTQVDNTKLLETNFDIVPYIGATREQAWLLFERLQEEISVKIKEWNQDAEKKWEPTPMRGIQGTGWVFQKKQSNGRDSCQTGMGARRWELRGVNGNLILTGAYGDGLNKAGAWWKY